MSQSSPYTSIKKTLTHTHTHIHTHIYVHTHTGITFPVMKKSDVNGPGALDLFKFLKGKTGQTEINWNFNKFLVTNGGVDVRRYIASVSPRKIEDDLRSALGVGEDL